jgi:hypothetical protein
MDESARKFLSENRDKFLYEPGELSMPEQYRDPNIPDLR